MLPTNEFNGPKFLVAPTRRHDLRRRRLEALSGGRLETNPIHDGGMEGGIMMAIANRSTHSK